MEKQQVAKTILEQLGGNRFIAMTGAKKFSYTENSLTFKIGRNGTSANSVTVTLKHKDLYDMKFERVSVSKKTFEVKRKEVSSHLDLYFDMLQDSFTQSTGLYTKL